MLSSTFSGYRWRNTPTISSTYISVPPTGDVPTTDCASDLHVSLKSSVRMVNVGHGVSLLSQGTGYGIIIGLGVLFAAVILIAVRIQRLYLMEDSGRSEMFMVANRSVGTGLTCSAVFSSWMWINETVFASVVCYQYGLAAPMWFGTGLSFQVALMAVLGVLTKLRVPHAHTSLEIVRKRYGNLGHVVFAMLNLINNIFGCSSMILAGSQLVVGITGMHLAAATILIPLGGGCTFHRSWSKD